MTREERKIKVEHDFTFLAISDAYSLIDQIYDDFEQRIKEYEFEMECYRQCEHQLGLCETALEEAESKVKELSDNLAVYPHTLYSMSKRAIEAEQHIKDLETQLVPKSCDGCLHIGKILDVCCDCSRMWSDKYKPKEL